jgi:hypothetical protein
MSLRSGCFAMTSTLVPPWCGRPWTSCGIWWPKCRWTWWLSTRQTGWARKYAYQALLIEEFAKAGSSVLLVKGPSSESPEDALLVQF